MRLYSYYESCQNRDIEDELRLMLLWREHHEKLGFEVKILSEYHARRHKDFKGYDAAIDELAAPGTEARATFMRWLAIASESAGRGIFLQYNTFLYPAVWDDLNPIHHLTGAEMSSLRIYQHWRPSLVVGASSTFLRQAERFATCKVENKVGSDAEILEAQAKALPDSFTQLPYVKDHGQDGWESAPAVRYPRRSIVGGDPRWKAIPQLRQYKPPET